MIIKIKSHKRASFQKILEYMMNDKDRLLDNDKKTFIITHNLKGKSIARWAQQYKENELLRVRNRKDSVRLSHEILSWHRDDAKSLTKENMECMVREYIKQRNPNGMYVAVPHFDKEHFHVHICASGIEYKTGKSLRMTKADFQRLKREIQNYQKENFPELSKSVVAHDKKEKSPVSEKEYQMKLRTARETSKQILLAALKTCYEKASSKENFLELLEGSNVKTYERTGKTTGVIFKGYKFRFERLGYQDKYLTQLDRSKLRGNELNEIRNQEPDIEINR